jgi:uncharacterized protein YjlB
MPASLTRGERMEQHQVVAALRAEGLAPYRWDNEAHFSYAPHAHTYHKVLVCLRGSIRFVLTGENGLAIDLQAGDRLELEAGTEHAAYVGPEGVACLEAQK